jgi:hypothetical protein
MPTHENQLDKSSGRFVDNHKRKYPAGEFEISVVINIFEKWRLANDKPAMGLWRRI